jgi:hypothetical protein
MKELMLVIALSTVPAGPWGGDGAVLQITSQGAHLELDCGLGELTEPLNLDSDQAFAVKGTFTREGGPARADGSDTRSARYTGRMEGSELTVELWSASGDAVQASWVFTRGREVQLRKCR